MTSGGPFREPCHCVSAFESNLNGKFPNYLHNCDVTRRNVMQHIFPSIFELYFKNSKTQFPHQFPKTPNSGASQKVATSCNASKQFCQTEPFDRGTRNNKKSNAKRASEAYRQNAKYIKWKNVSLIDEPPVKVTRNIIFRETTSRL